MAEFLDPEDAAAAACRARLDALIAEPVADVPMPKTKAKAKSETVVEAAPVVEAAQAADAPEE